MSLLEQATDDKLEERAWLYYCITLPYQDKKNKKTFQEFMATLRSPKNATKTKITKEQLEHYADIADLVRSR